MDDLICITQAAGVNDDLELNKGSSGAYSFMVAFFIKDFNCASDSTGFACSILNQ